MRGRRGARAWFTRRARWARSIHIHKISVFWQLALTLPKTSPDILRVMKRYVLAPSWESAKSAAKKGLTKRLVFYPPGLSADFTWASQYLILGVTIGCFLDFSITFSVFGPSTETLFRVTFLADPIIWQPYHSQRAERWNSRYSHWDLVLIPYWGVGIAQVAHSQAENRILSLFVWQVKEMLTFEEMFKIVWEFDRRKFNFLMSSHDLTNRSINYSIQNGITYKFQAERRFYDFVYWFIPF